MDEKGQDKVMAFDTLFTTNHLQMLKVLTSYLDPAAQKSMAVYIKWMELQYTLSFFRKYPGASLAGLPREDKFDGSRLCDEMLPYCVPREKEQLQSMKNMFQNLAGMQEMMEMMQMMKELFPEGENPFQGDASEMLSGLMGKGKAQEGQMDLSQLMSLFQNLQ
nr:hypothetical protein [uncultured Acetatifactor sp.]